MVDAVRAAEQSLGKVTYDVTEKEARSRIFRRSLFVVNDMRAGDAFTETNVRSIRPGYGLHTRHLPEVLGKRAAKDISRGTPMEWSLVAK
jgi:sialic acid synthase SpsE